MNHFKLPCRQFCTGVVRWLAVGAWMIALCVPGSLFAQSHEITGKVLDENDMPVVGANIIVDGTTIGTNSGLDGSFKLTVSPPPPQDGVRHVFGVQNCQTRIRFPH